jgi:hypothetical protein
MDEPRISVGLPQLLDEQSADVVKRFAACGYDARD